MSALDEAKDVIYEVRQGKSGVGDTPSIGPTYGNVLATKGYEAPADKCKNLFEVFESSVKIYADRPCLGRRINGQGPYVWETYKVS